jgi:zona occludens toxin
VLYLVTGANGTGKTLLTLKHVKELADREGRPVCHNGRFDPRPDGPLRNWRKIDMKDWQAEPDGTIFFVDEAHNDFPKRGNSDPVPEYVRMLAEHRKRGFDFFIITQHPMNIDAFVRRLIGNPGWHRHLKRQAGMALVSQSQWDAVNPNCERPGSGESGQVTMVPYPKEVYAWYTSAQLHTAKVKIPRAVWVLGGCALLVPALAWLGYHSLFSSVLRPEAASADKPRVSSPSARPLRASSVPDGDRGPLTAADYVTARTPRLAGLPFTAPAYDKVTEPTVAPYPAACILHHDSGRCDCYTQQATRLETPQEVCQQIARSGLFVDWQQQVAGVASAAAPLPASVPGGLGAASGAASGRGAGGGGSGSGGGAAFVEVAQSPVFLSSPGDYTPTFYPAIVNEVRPLSDQERRDAAIGAAMHSGDWARH